MTLATPSAAHTEAREATSGNHAALQDGKKHRFNVNAGAESRIISQMAKAFREQNFLKLEKLYLQASPFPRVGL